MKNLKKVLAFMLVAAMMVSMAVSASALSAKDFTDYDEIVNTDAVAMLTELKIINGYPTGDYQPSGIVTRAEMAKMIYTALMGGSDSAPVNTTNKYSDVWSGMWCEGYIAFCDELGIIEGYGDGTFGPNDPVTGVQAAKMLLVAMGYDSAKEGFSSDAQWNYNILKVASAKGLFEGFDADTSAGCTRDNAALLIYNALLAETVTYVGTSAIDNGETLLGNLFGVVAVTGVVVANEYANLFDTEPLKTGYTEIAFIGDQYVDMDHAIDPMKSDFFTKWYNGKLSSDDYTIGDFAYGDGSVGIDEDILDLYDWAQLKEHVNDNDEYESFVFTVSTDLAQVGQTVTVYAKLKGTYEKFTNLVEYNAYDMFSGAVVGNVVIDDDSVMATAENGEYLNVKTDANTRYFENYTAVWASVDGERPYAFDDAVDNNRYSFYFDGSDLLSTVRGERAWAFDNDHDGVAEIVIKTRQTFAVVKYDSYYDTYTFDTNSTIVKNAWCSADGDLVEWANIPSNSIVFDGELKAGMKVLVMPIDGTYYVVECDTLEGTPTKLYYNKEAKEYNVEFDGETYFESGLYWADDIKDLHDSSVVVSAKDSAFYHIVSAMSDTEYVCYLDEFGNIVAYEDVSTPTSMGYFLVTGAAYEIQSLNNTDSIIFGAKASDSTSIGANGYYAGRTGRSDTVISSVGTLFEDNAQSTDKIMAGIVALNGVKKYQYVSYANVMKLDNNYNVKSSTETYGQYTTLTKAAFDENDTITKLSGIYANDVLALTTWELDQNTPSDKEQVINGSSDIIYYNDGSKLYVGSKTVFFIYMVDESTGRYNVITTTGYKNLPEMVIASNNDGYGICNVYGVDAGSGSVDARAVVFELKVNFATGDGLPVQAVSNFVYVYDVDSVAFKSYCQHIYAISADGKLVDFYADSYDVELDATDKGWYAYFSTDTNTECGEDHEHYILSKVDRDGNISNEFISDVYNLESELLTANVYQIDTRTHNGECELFVGDASSSSSLGYVDLSDAKVFIHCSNVSGKYNGMECIPTTLGTLEDEASYPSQWDLVSVDDNYILTFSDKVASMTSNASTQVIYKKVGNSYQVVAFIISVDGLSYAEYSELAADVGVSEAASTAADGVSTSGAEATN